MALPKSINRIVFEYIDGIKYYTDNLKEGSRSSAIKYPHSASFPAKKQLEEDYIMEVRITFKKRKVAEFDILKELA